MDVDRQSRHTNLVPNPRTRHYRVGSEIIVWLSPDESVPATILDVSEDQIAVAVENEHDFEISFYVKIGYPGARRMALIRDFTKDAPEMWRLDLLWSLA